MAEASAYVAQFRQTWGAGRPRWHFRVLRLVDGSTMLVGDSGATYYDTQEAALQEARQVAATDRLWDDDCVVQEPV